MTPEITPEPKQHKDQHEHFDTEYHSKVEKEQKAINFLDFFSSMDVPQTKTKIDTDKFWEDIRNGSNDTHGFQKKLSQKKYRTSSGTQSWKIPPGILTSLNSKNWSTFGGANFNESYFPLDYDKNQTRTDFLTRSNIKSKTILNPPFKDETIEGFLAHILKLSETNHKHFFVILPLRTEKKWFQKFIINSEFTKILFKNKLAFLRGTDESFHGVANEKHLIWTVGINGPNIPVDNTPLGDFTMEWKLFARMNFLYNIMGQPPIGKLKEWSKKLEKSLQKRNQIRMEHFQRQTLQVNPIKTPWKLSPPAPTNIMEDNIRGRTPAAWATRLETLSKKNKMKKLNSRKATKLFEQIRKHTKTLHHCEICLSDKHNTKYCTQYTPTGEEIQDKADSSLFNFFNGLPTEDGNGIFPILKQEDLPDEEIVRRFQHRRYTGTDQRKRKLAIQYANQRAKQCWKVMNKLKITWQMPKNLTFSYVRYHLPYFYGYGLPKKYILRMAKGYRIRPDSKIDQKIHVFHNNKMNQKETDKRVTTIRKRMLQGKIIPVSEKIPIIINPEFIVTQDEKVRPVLDCSALNGIYTAESITFPTTDTAIKIAKNHWVAAVDLKSAYNQCPVYAPDLQFFAITSDGKYFIPTGLPQGFNRAPEIFTRFLDPIMELFIDLGILTTKLLDDLLFVLGTSKETKGTLQEALDDIRQIIADLGLRTNSKSQEGAYSEIVYLGKLINTALGQTFITPEKLEKTIHQAIELIITEKVTIKKIAQAIGLANFLKVSAPRKFRHIFRRISETTKGTMPMAPTKKDWEKMYETKIELTIQAKMEIVHWLDTLHTLVDVKTNSDHRTQVVLYADTGDSHTGVYVKIGDEEWTVLTLDLPFEFNNKPNEVNSTAREIIGIKKGIDYALKNSKDKLHIRTYCDNEASSYQFQTMNAEDNKTRTALEGIYTLEKQHDLQITWIWNRRTTKVAKYTDFLSKELHIRPKQKLKDLLQRTFNNHIQNICDDKRFLKQVWRYSYMTPKDRKYFTKDTLLFIHPDIYIKQRWDILDWADEYQYKGAILMPAVTRNPLRNLLRRNLYDKHFIPKNKLKSYVILSPKFSPKNRQRSYIIFQRRKIHEFRPTTN